MNIDYDILPFSDGDGELFLSADLSASYRYVGHGHVLIHLEHRDGTAHDGWQNQSDKARDVCRLWIETGIVPQTLLKLPEVPYDR